MLKRIQSLGLALLLSVGVGSVGHAASFDCSKATTETEIAICNDPELSVLDERMSKAYLKGRALGNLTRIKEDQLTWIEVRNRCTNELCIKTSYLGRLKELEDFDYEYKKSKFKKDANCTDEDWDYAKSWDNYYDPEMAFRFGEVIQKILINKDIEGLIEIIEGELTGGFRKTVARSSSFEKVLQRNTIISIVGHKPNCSPVGWRGFMIGNGLAWYQCNKTSCELTSIDSITEKLEFIEFGWKISNEIIHPQCFAYEWESGDNFEDFAEQNDIRDYQDFRRNTGTYLGKTLRTFAPISPSWCEGNHCKKLSLVNSLNKCGSIVSKNIPNSFVIEFEDLSYSVLDRKIDNCKSLVPHFEKNVIECRLVLIAEKTGGTIGTYIRYGIYGISDLPKDGLSILPLKFFDNLNYALNFLDEINNQ